MATAAADGGVTFNNIAAGDGAGITYRRATSPDREAVHIAARQQVIPLAQFPAFVRESAQKWHGAPGVAILDFDKDGDLDIYVPNGPGRNNSLYSNQLMETGVVSFVDVGASAGVGLLNHDSSGVCFGDIDNDGDEDLYVLGSGYSNHLFENQGDGTFSDITPGAGVAGPSHFYYAACSMADFNHDGLLDIVVGTTYHPW
ncbi:MAG TPA: VCBS repeat-containing protein, partial [Thermoanaerobaculia bacterium]|nr:VCBS repeat-containing protein [Thermoanaerobaculia bacterium]